MSVGCQNCNLLIISVDTLRADRLGAYGHYRNTSPNIDAFAKEGVLFEQFVQSGGGTLPSHLTMLTSLNPITHAVDTHTNTSLPEERVTLAEHLAQAGYRTAGFTDGGWMRAKFGFSQGFDTFDDEGGRFDAILPKAHKWLKRHWRLHGKEPFFLFLHTYDVHSEWRQLPYDCPGDYPLRFTSDFDVEFDGCRDGKCASELLSWVNSRVLEGDLTGTDYFTPAELEFMQALYDGCIRYVDDKIAEILGWLREQGVYDDTLIVLISDHGEEFLEHGMLLHDQGGYEELVHIPWILKLPNSAHAGRRLPQLASMVDVLPTVVDLLDLPPVPQAQGISFVPLITGVTNKPLRRAAHIFRVIRTPEWKFFSHRDRLFDLQADPTEQQNLFGERPEVTHLLGEYIAKMVQRDEEWRKQLDAGSPSEPEENQITLTEEEIESLRALGYLD